MDRWAGGMPWPYSPVGRVVGIWRKNKTSKPQGRVLGCCLRAAVRGKSLRGLAKGRLLVVHCEAALCWLFSDTMARHNGCVLLPQGCKRTRTGRSCRYHTGSLAFGALVISVLTFFRILLEYLERKMKGLKSSVSKFFCCCLQCCFCSLDTFLSYINSNAYIMMAIYGKSLCRSAREAFCLLMRNLLRVAVVDRVTDFLLFLGKVLVSGGTGVLAGLFFTGRLPLLQDHVPGLHRSLLPTLTVVAGSYLVAHGFFSVYQTCVDTFFLCFCDDLERNDGSAEKPYLTSPDLHRILEKSRRSH